MPKLVVFRGDAVENEIRLAGNTVRVGRHARNDVVLDDGKNGVSRFHAEIRAEGGSYSIVDLNSRNGVWINGRKIKDKAPLALGVPVTVGAFELALEDDVSTGDFGDQSIGQPTVASVTSVGRKDGPGRSGAGSKPRRSPLSATQRQVLLWSAAAAAVVLLCAVTFAVVRYRSRPVSTVAIVEPTTSIPPQVVETPPAPAEDPIKKQNEQDLADARAQIDAHEYAAAISDHLQPLLERDPENVEARELKQRADQAIAAAQAQKRPPPKVEPPPEPETPGIARKPNEVYADYLVRVKRIQTAYSDGKASLDKQDYATALARFRAIDRDQPKYLNVDMLIAETARQQQKAFEEAMGNGQQGEQGDKLRLARQWYQRAMEIDPSSTSAREKNAALLGRMNADATKLFDAGSYAKKSDDPKRAIEKFQAVVDLMLPGDEIRARALKELETLKR